MLFRKTERKKSNMGVILTVGALAAIGAWTITQKSKTIVDTALCKLKSMWNNTSGCSKECGENQSE